MATDSEFVSLLRDQLANIFFGTFFLLIGLISFAIAAIRRRSGVRILIWLGVWSGMFGLNELLRSPAISTALGPPWRAPSDTFRVLISYLLVIVGTLSFYELALGKLRPLLRLLLIADSVIAIAGIAAFFATGSASTFMMYNNLLSAITLAVLVAVSAVPKLSRRFMVVSGHRVFTIGTLIFAAQALAANLARPLNFQSSTLSDSLGFAVLLLSFAYTALAMLLANERRLIALDNELQIARQLQFSILPDTPPALPDLRISAAYLPMTAVAGDFYEFIPVDLHHNGFLIADVSGHGVPAALIASMIKIAAQSVNDCAWHPAEVLRRLGRSLASHLRGHLVSAAYLWIDTESRTARYSAAGHPPLLCWRSADATLHRIESNGLLFGITADSEYPECEFPLSRGDRLLLYTDGVIEPENAFGEPFETHRLEKVVKDNSLQSAAILSERLLVEVGAWLPASLSQQDDITLIVIDVL